MYFQSTPQNVVILIAVLVRYLVSLWPYSGAGDGPKFGDYEAQRHWMELTLHLPVADWYRNSTGNDLQHWGLDYPPLTAFGSLLCGIVGHRLEPECFALVSSRGYESPSCKLFMRATALLADLAVFFPAAICFASSFYRRGDEQAPRTLLLAATLLQPALILIDHGHFQYNSVSLGLTLAAVACIFDRRPLCASALFCLSLNYKQMSLYHAAPFFFYLLGLHFDRRNLVRTVFDVGRIGAVVIAAFALCWAPFISHGPDAVAQVLQRLFPFGRGVFEDKVANLWCSLSPVLKLPRLLSTQHIALLCLTTTALALLPSGIDLLLRPTKRRFLYALANASLAFFLFSYQVHEKSLLLPLLPVTLLIVEQPTLAAWFNAVAAFSMYPLLTRDGLTTPYLAFLGAWALYTWPIVAQKARPFVLLSMLGMAVLHVLFAFVPPPPRYPDLFTLLFTTYSFVHLGTFWLYLHWAQFRLPQTESEHGKTKSS